MIREEIENRNLPELFEFSNGNKVQSLDDWKKRRVEIKKILCEEEYGLFPKSHVPISVKILEEDSERYCRGKVVYKKILLTLNFESEEFSFPVCIAVPKQNRPCPAFLYVSFYDSFPNKYLPVEEICDQGFAVVSFCYEDVTSDDDDFLNGLSKFFSELIVNNKVDGFTIENVSSCFNYEKRNFGKILVWSWAAMHVMDYIEKIEEIDKNNIAIVGHSRLGKTALLTGAFDDRFRYTISNDSGQSGAAISRGKDGERISDICKRFSYWFNSDYEKYSNNEGGMPFDQHFLLSLVAPRNLYVASASEDLWADPKSEFLSSVAISKVYELYGKNGLIYEEKFPEVGTKLMDGDVGYHLREGCHYLSRHDWNIFIEYINRHRM